jgi:hypothetical protein
MQNLAIRKEQIELHLPVFDFHRAAIAAVERMADSQRQNLNHAKSVSRTLGERLLEETVGCAAEIAWARMCDDAQHELPINTFHVVADHGDDLEIRGSDKTVARLIVRKDEPRDRRYVLFTIQFGPTLVKAYPEGWIYGDEAFQTKYLANPNDARESYFVPKANLQPMSELEVYRGDGTRVHLPTGYVNYCA